MRLALFVLVAVLVSGCVVEGPSTTTVPASTKPTAEEMYYEAAQCENPWTGHGGVHAQPGTTDEADQIGSYYAAQSVTMEEIRFERVYDATCEACGCPRGDWIITTILAEDVDQARSLDWQDYTGPPT